MVKQQKETPAKIRARLYRLLDELCKKSVENPKLSIDYRYVEIDKFLWENKDKWVGKTYGLNKFKFNGCPTDELRKITEEHFFELCKISALDRDLKKLEELNYLKFESDKKSVRISLETVMENGKKWWQKIYEKQPANAISIPISVISLIVSIIALWCKLK